MNKLERFVIIDGNSLINRAYYAIRPLTTRDGRPSNAVYGFTTMLLKMIADYTPKYLAVAFDMRAPTFRHKMYDGYKAARKGMPDDLAAQMPMLKEMLSAMGIKILEREGFEADDILGTLAHCCSVPAFIVTGDRDALQLVSDSVSVVLTKHGMSEVLTVTPENIVAEFGLTSSQIVDYKALAGDSSDSIPGVSGIGDKTATDLLQKYGNLDNIYQNIGEIRGKLAEKLTADKAKAYLSRELATIKTDCTLSVQPSGCEFDYPFSAKVVEIFHRYNFTSLIKRTELFLSGVSLPESESVKVKSVTVKTADEFARMLGGAEIFSLTVDKEITACRDGETEIKLLSESTLFDPAPVPSEVFCAIKGLLEASNVVKVLYDAKKVKKMLHKSGINLCGYFDVALAQYLVDMNIKYSSVANYSAACGYISGADAVCLYNRYAFLARELKSLEMEQLYQEVELPLVDVLLGMEEVGFKLDMKHLGELNEIYALKEKAVADRIIMLAGRPFNINSPKQLGVILFDELKIPYPKKGGARSTSAEILSQIEGEEIVGEVLKYRFLAKIRSTYLEGLLNQATPAGEVHTEFNQMLTTTGRLSSSEPNLQNIPVREDESRELRGLFVARPGNVLVVADYSQIELRVMAHMSKDAALTAAYLRGEDIHTAVARELFDLSGEVSSSLFVEARRFAKTVNFGIIYGMSAFGLASRLGVTNYEAKNYIEKYFAKYHGVKKYLDEVIESAKKLGYASSILGRRRVIPELKSSDFKLRSFGERAAMNMPLQSSAADIIKLAMLRVSEKLAPLKAKLILQVHDELIVECPENELDEVKKILKNEMENAMKLSVPLVAVVQSGNSWLDCK